LTELLTELRYSPKPLNDVPLTPEMVKALSQWLHPTGTASAGGTILPFVPAVPVPSSVSLPATSTGTPASGAAPSNRLQVKNVQYDVKFQPFKDLHLSLGTIRTKAKEKGHEVPKNDQDTEMCLCYHVMGFCWDNCKRQLDHRAHSAPETKRLLDWCTKCFRADGPSA
jgi:hypothetical protein